MRKCFYIMAVGVWLLGGCSTTLKVTPTSNLAHDEIGNGLTFYLPKTLLEVNASYAPDASGNMSLPSAHDLKVSTLAIADAHASFMLDPDSMRGFLKDGKLDVDLAENGTLKSVNATLTDQTSAIVGSLTSAFTNLSTLGALKPKSLRDGEYLKVRALIDPAELAYQADGSDQRAEYVFRDVTKSPDGQTTPLPVLKLVLLSAVDMSRSSVASSQLKYAGKPVAALDGIPYRTPAPVRVQVYVDDELIDDRFHPFLQAGRLSLAPVRSAMFSNKVQTMTFEDGTGTLSNYVSDDTASGTALSSTAASTTASLLDHKTEKMQAEIEYLEKLSDLVDKRRALEEKLAASNNTSPAAATPAPADDSPSTPAEDLPF